MLFPNFIGPTYQSRSLVADAEQCVNLYPEFVESGAGKNKIVLYGTPGLLRIGQNPDGTFRQVSGAIMAMKPFWNTSAGQQQTYILSTGLEVNSSARTISLYLLQNMGLLASATLPVSYQVKGSPPQAAFMASNGKQIIIALKMSDDPTGEPAMSSLLYSFDMTAAIPALTQVTSWDSTQPITGLDFLDGFFLVTTTTSLYASAAGDGTSWNALNYTNESDEPDGITGLIVDHRLIWILGKNRVEAFYNAGGQYFPFQRVPQGVMEIGCSCAGSIVALDESIFWVGFGKQGGPVVYRNSGYTPVRISNHYVESVLTQYAGMSDQVNPAGLSGYAGGGTVNAAWTGLQAYAYREDGHLFYVLNFGGNNIAANAAYGYQFEGDPGTTLVYDVTSQLWHERQSVGTQAGLSRHLGNFYSYDALFGHVVSDYRNTNLYSMSLSSLNDNGTAITRWRTAPHIADENKRILYSRFELDLELEGPSTMSLALQWSDDGGRTWSTPVAIQFGVGSGLPHRAVWRRLGVSRDRIFKVSTSDQIKVAWINAYLEMSQGNS